MRNILALAFFVCLAMQAGAQRVLSLDSCRALALRNNKQLGIARLQQDVALNTRKAARTKYLPHVSVVGGYEFTSKEVSILNNDQKNKLANLGTNAMPQISQGLSDVIAEMTRQGVITPQAAASLGDILGEAAGGIQQAGDAAGSALRDAFKTDTRNFFMASVMLQQPIYMGGAITAGNRMADINEMLARNVMQGKIQSAIYDTDQAYWLIVSLRHKEKLAQSYLELVRKLDSDVSKMIAEGVATKADGLRVSVKVNEAEMQLTQAEDGVALAKMYLCQLCGLPIDTAITLEDEDKDQLSADEPMPKADINAAMENRPELKALQNAAEISSLNTKMTRAEYLPQVALTAGYTVTNPSVYNGFENKFSGIWNVGVMVRMPVWSWFEGTYKIRASKAAANIAAMELYEAREKVELQINQNEFKVKEALKRLQMADKNTEHADENLRCANLGFSEGVMEVSTVMEAQTAWLQAKSQRIDAEIDVKLAQTGLKKALGALQY